LRPCISFFSPYPTLLRLTSVFEELKRQREM
jgi:hypothetical protein